MPRVDKQPEEVAIMMKKRVWRLIVTLVGAALIVGCAHGKERETSTSGATYAAAPFAVTINDSNNLTIWPKGVPQIVDSVESDLQGVQVVPLPRSKVAFLMAHSWSYAPEDVGRLRIVNESGEGPSMSVEAGCNSIAPRGDEIILLCAQEIPGGYKVHLKMLDEKMQVAKVVDLQIPATRISGQIKHAEPPMLVAAGPGAFWIGYPSETAFARGGGRVIVKFSTTGKPLASAQVDGLINKFALAPDGLSLAVEGYGSGGACSPKSVVHVIDLVSMKQRWNSVAIPGELRESTEISGSRSFGLKSLFWVDDNLLQIDGYTYPDSADNCDESVRRYWRRELNPKELRAKDEQIERNDYEEVSWMGPECDAVFRNVGENKIAIVRNGVETMTSENRVVLESRRPKECS